MLRSRSQNGFTLLELLVVVGIVGVMLAAAIPSFQQMGLASSRAQGGTLLMAAFNQARSEAIARNANVIVCRRNYFTTSSFPVCDMSSTGSWAQGWIVYRDSDSTIDSSEPDAAADIIAVYEPIGSVKSGNVGNAFSVLPSSNPAYVVFGSNGRTTQALGFTLCDSSHRLTDGRRVEIALSGYVSLRALDTTTATSLCT
jgi:type IV fimbrial biogenesis protein FimT